MTGDREAPAILAEPKPSVSVSALIGSGDWERLDRVPFPTEAEHGLYKPEPCRSCGQVIDLSMIGPECRRCALGRAEEASARAELRRRAARMARLAAARGEGGRDASS